MSYFFSMKMEAPGSSERLGLFFFHASVKVNALPRGKHMNSYNYKLSVGYIGGLSRINLETVKLFLRHVYFHSVV